VTGHGGKPLIGEKIVVKRGVNGLLDVRIQTNLGEKTITTPFVEVEGNRIAPAPQKGIIWNGKTYSLARFGPPVAKPKPRVAPKDISTDYIILMKEWRKRHQSAPAEPEESEIHGQIESHAHWHPPAELPDDKCKDGSVEKCKDVQR
jgi:hypothetical protein